MRQPSLAVLAVSASEVVLDSYLEMTARLSWLNMGDKIETHLKSLNAGATDEDRISALAHAPHGPLTRSGLAGLWLCRAVEADDAKALARLIQAGADPWALAVGGWHPLDWAWEARARACAPLLAEALIGEELHHMQIWTSKEVKIYKDITGTPFASSHPIMSSVFITSSEADGFAGVSRTPCLPKLRQRVKQDPKSAPRGPGRFASKLSILARTGKYPGTPKLDQEAALRAWLHVQPKGEMQAWVKTLVECMELDAEASSGKPSVSARL